MSALLLTTAVVLALLVLLLAIPLAVSFRFAGIDDFGGEIRFRWLFGLVRVRLPIPRVRKAKAGKRKPGPKTEKAARRQARHRPADILAVLRQPAFRRRVFRFAGDTLRALHAHQLYLRVRLGLGDPAETGRLWGVLAPVQALAHGIPNADVRLEPEFIEPALEFETHGRFLMIPLQFIALAIGFALSPPSLRAWRTLRGNRV